MPPSPPRPSAAQVPPRFNKILEEQTFETAVKADEAAALQLTHLKGVDDEGGLLWNPRD